RDAQPRPDGPVPGPLRRRARLALERDALPPDRRALAGEHGPPRRGAAAGAARGLRQGRGTVATPLAPVLPGHRRPVRPPRRRRVGRQPLFAQAPMNQQTPSSRTERPPEREDPGPSSSNLNAATV